MNSHDTHNKTTNILKKKDLHPALIATFLFTVTTKHREGLALMVRARWYGFVERIDQDFDERNANVIVERHLLPGQENLISEVFP